MEKAKKLSEVELSNTTFSKNVRLYQKGVEVGGFARQDVQLKPKSDHLLQFNYEDQALLDVDEKDGKYTLHIPGIERFKDKDGNIFPGLNNGELILDPENSSITMSHNTEELRFEIKSQDEKKYVITTGAYGIKIQVEDSNGVSNFNFRIPPIKENDNAPGVGITIEPRLLEEFLNPDKKLCKFNYPKSGLQTTMQSSPEKSLSVDLFSSFIQTLQPGDMIDFLSEKGNGYYVSLLPNQGTELNADGKHRPPAFITQIKDGKRKNFLFVNGHFRHCDNYRFMSINDKDGTIRPLIVFETGNSTPHVHYKYELPVKDGTLTSEANAILDQVRDIFSGPAINLATSKVERANANKFKSETIVDGKTSENNIYFEKTDSRLLDNLRDYDIRRNADEVYNDEDINEPNSIDPDPPTGNDVTGDENSGNEDKNYLNADENPNPDNGNPENPNPDGNENAPDGDQNPVNPDESGNRGDQVPPNAALGQQPDSAEEQEVGKPEPSAPDKSDPDTETVLDLSQPIEAISDTLCTVGVFLLLGAILTGGLTLIAGLVVGMIGFAGVITADKYKFRPLKRAQKKVKDLERQEKEDAEEVEKQNENEAEVDRADEAANESDANLNNEIKNEFSGENTLDDLDVEGNQLQQTLTNEMGQQNGFASLYEKYGILPNEGRKVDTLTSYDGLDARRLMLSQLSAIQSASPAEREQRVNDFINSNFTPIPPEERKQLTEGEGILANTDEGREKFGTFITALRESVALDEEKERLLDAQKQFVATSRDSALEKFMTSSDITPEQREKRFQRYAEVIVRRYANDSRLTENRLERLISKLPEEERVHCGEILNNAQTAITIQVTAVQELARLNAAHSAELAKVESIAHTIEAAQQHESFVSMNILEDDAAAYMQHSLYSYYGNQSDLQTLSSLREGTQVATTTSQERAAMDAMANIFNSGLATRVGNAYKKVTDILFSGNYNNILTNAYLHPELMGGVKGFPAAGKRFQVDGKTIGTDGEMLGRLVEFVIPKESQGPVDINLKDAYEQYQREVAAYKNALTPNLRYATDNVYKIRLDPSYLNSNLDKDSLQHEIDSLTKTYGSKFTDFKNARDTYTTTSIQERIATILLEARSLNESCPQEIRDIYTQFANTFEFVMSGKCAYAQMEEAIRATSEDMFEDKTLEDTESKLRGDITTYNNTLAFLDSLPAAIKNKVVASYNTLLLAENEDGTHIQPKRALVQAIKQEFDEMEFEGKDRFAPLIEGLSKPNPEADAPEKITTLLGNQREIIANRGKIQSSIYREALGRESVDSVYAATFENRQERRRQPKVARTELTRKEQQLITEKETELIRFNSHVPIIEDIINRARSGNFENLIRLMAAKNSYLETLSNEEAVTINPSVCKKYLEQIGLSQTTLTQILKLPADKRSVEFENLCKGAHISERLSAIKENMELELRALRMIDTKMTTKDRKRARKLTDETQRLCDIETLRCGIDQIGQAKYVDEQTWKDFVLNNAALLERLGIKPETLTDKDKRTKNLSKLTSRLKKMESKANKQYKKQTEKQDKEAKKPSADMSARSANNIREAMRAFGRILHHVNETNRERDAERIAQQEEEARRINTNETENINDAENENSENINDAENENSENSEETIHDIPNPDPVYVPIPPRTFEDLNENHEQDNEDGLDM